MLTVKIYRCISIGEMPADVSQSSLSVRRPSRLRTSTGGSATSTAPAGAAGPNDLGHRLNHGGPAAHAAHGLSLRSISLGGGSPVQRSVWAYVHGARRRTGVS